MLAWLHDLYAIDALAVDLDERARLRATESRAVTEKMKAWMHHTTALKTTSLGAAIRYTLFLEPADALSRGPRDLVRQQPD